MDFVNKFTGGEQKNEQQNVGSSEQKQEDGGFLGGIGNKMNEAAGGGAAGEKNEDMLDKGMWLWRQSISSRRPLTCPGVDFVQEKFLGQGPQDNEVCALERTVCLQ